MKLTITKQELENIYRENSNKKACQILKITNSTLTKYLRANNIALKGSGNGKSEHRTKLNIILND